MEKRIVRAYNTAVLKSIGEDEDDPFFTEEDFFSSSFLYIYLSRRDIEFEINEQFLPIFSKELYKELDGNYSEQSIDLALSFCWEVSDTPFHSNYIENLTSSIYTSLEQSKPLLYSKGATFGTDRAIGEYNDEFWVGCIAFVFIVIVLYLVYSSS